LEGDEKSLLIYHLMSFCATVYLVISNSYTAFESRCLIFSFLFHIQWLAVVYWYGCGIVAKDKGTKKGWTILGPASEACGIPKFIIS